MRTWGLRAPLWVVFVVAATLFGAGMGLFSLLAGASPGPAAAGAVAGGLLWASPMTWMISRERARYRAAVGPVAAEEMVEIAGRSGRDIRPPTPRCAGRPSVRRNGGRSPHGCGR